MRISVAMATYNGARFLPDQLRSLAEQTHLPAELVVSDDGSTDDTLAVVGAFAAKAPFPVRILRKDERLGFADNFLFAAEGCQHELVAFCDQDDVWLPNKLEIGRARIEAESSLLAMHTLTTTDEELRPLHVWSQGIAVDGSFEPLVLFPYITGWGNSMLFRRELVHLFDRSSRPTQPESPERPLSHDTWIYVLASALGRVSHIDEPLILYRQHGLNAQGIEPWRPTLRGRLSAWLNPGLPRLREQCLFYGRMAAVFNDIASRTGGPFARPARRAAACYEARRRSTELRVALHMESSFSARLRAYRTAKKLPRDPPHWLGSRAKEIVLGVSGLHASRSNG